MTSGRTMPSLSETPGPEDQTPLAQPWRDTPCLNGSQSTSSTTSTRTSKKSTSPKVGLESNTLVRLIPHSQPLVMVIPTAGALHRPKNNASIQDLEQQFGSMEGAETYVGEIYSAASRSFDEARKLVNQAKQARGYFPVVGVGIYDDGLSSLPGNRTPVARGRAPRGKGGNK